MYYYTKPFSSPEAVILLVSTKDQDLWLDPILIPEPSGFFVSGGSPEETLGQWNRSVPGFLAQNNRSLHETANQKNNSLFEFPSLSRRPTAEKNAWGLWDRLWDWDWTGTNVLSMHRVFVLYFQPNLKMHLWIMDSGVRASRGLDPWCWPKGSWALTRMYTNQKFVLSQVHPDGWSTYLWYKLIPLQCYVSEIFKSNKTWTRILLNLAYQ